MNILGTQYNCISLCLEIRRAFYASFGQWNMIVLIYDIRGFQAKVFTHWHLTPCDPFCLSW